MAIAWGNFESMALHYIKLLASPTERDPIWIEDGNSGTYGVCTYMEFAQLVALRGEGTYRPVCTMTKVEFLGLLLIRYKDFFPEEENGNEKKDISTGELSSGEPAALDAGGDRGSEGGRGDGNGRGKKKDNSGTVH